MYGEGKAHLLDLGEVVLRVLVEDELADGAQGELGVWPDLGEIEDVVAEFLRLLGCHRLLRTSTGISSERGEDDVDTHDVDSPRGEFACLDRVV